MRLVHEIDPSRWPPALSPIGRRRFQAVRNVIDAIGFSSNSTVNPGKRSIWRHHRAADDDVAHPHHLTLVRQ